MSLIKFDSLGRGKVSVLCPICEKSIGVMDFGELFELMRADVYPVCFDCDTGEIDDYPRQLCEYEEVFLLVILDKPFCCQWVISPDFRKSKIECRLISWAMWATILSGVNVPVVGDGVLLPLSSSTYLHAEAPGDGR